MIAVGVSGAAGRMGSLVCQALTEADDLQLGGRYDPSHNLSDSLDDVDVIVEFTRPDVVLDNLATWHKLQKPVVVGTSGFDEARLSKLSSFWSASDPACLIVPNFSIGAVLMMRFAEEAAPFFAGAEVVDLHHDKKVDAPSGTALATAARMKPKAMTTTDDGGARGSRLGDVQIHSVRLPGLLAHHEVILGNHGEILTIRHDTNDRTAFLPGVLTAIRKVGGLHGVVVGLEAVMF